MHMTEKCARGRLKGNDLVCWRKGLNLTRVEAAGALQIPFETYRQYERDKNSIPSVVEVAIWWVSWKMAQGQNSPDGMKSAVEWAKEFNFDPSVDHKKLILAIQADALEAAKKCINCWDGEIRSKARIDGLKAAKGDA